MAKAKNTNGSPENMDSQLVPSLEQVEEKEVIHEVEVEEKEVIHEVEVEEKEVIHEVEVNFTTASKPFTNPNDVEFLVEYSKDFKGKKIVPEGITIVSKETAELFEARGMGIKVK